jgi:Transmembrane domain of unknown function (DUF3566)
VSTGGQTGTAVRADGSAGPAQTVGGSTLPGSDRLASPRRVKLSVSRVDPWTAMKLSFLLSVAVGIAAVVMVSVLWLVLSSMGVFTDMNRTVEGVLNTSNGAKFDLMNYIGLGRVVSLSIVIAVIDVILVTAISTLGAVLYNVCSSLVGGLQVTLTDD